jgi:dephospho-CoA kinase
MIIGITGGTGCGKTTLLNLIRENGGLVLDCDAIYHQLLKTDTSLLNAIEGRFPGTVAHGELQRKNLGAIVFADPHALEDLNAITHSAIRQAVEDRLIPGKNAAIDAIALFESGMAELCDVTVAVTAPGEQRISRLMARDGITEAYAISRIQAQPTEEYFRNNCGYVLENDGDGAQFRHKCLAFFRQLGIMKENPQEV